MEHKLRLQESQEDSSSYCYFPDDHWQPGSQFNSGLSPVVVPSKEIATSDTTIISHPISSSPEALEFCPEEGVHKNPSYCLFEFT